LPCRFLPSFGADENRIKEEMQKTRMRQEIGVAGEDEGDDPSCFPVFFLVSSTLLLSALSPPKSGVSRQHFGFLDTRFLYSPLAP
jgi:hypothetical protein